MLFTLDQIAALTDRVTANDPQLWSFLQMTLNDDTLHETLEVGAVFSLFDLLSLFSSLFCNIFTAIMKKFTNFPTRRHTALCNRNGYLC